METPVEFLIVKFDGYGMVSILVHSPDEARQVETYTGLVVVQGPDCTLPYTGTSDSPSKGYYQIEMNGGSPVPRRRSDICALHLDYGSRQDDHSHACRSH